MNILIVEDDFYIRKYLQKVLKKLKHNVEISEDGYSALAILKEHNISYYKILIVDLKMPRMDGYKFILEAKNINMDFNFVVISANLNNDENLCNVKKMNIKHIILKPFELNQLLQTIKEIENEQNCIN